MKTDLCLLDHLTLQKHIQMRFWLRKPTQKIQCTFDAFVLLSNGIKGYKTEGTTKDFPTKTLKYFHVFAKAQVYLILFFLFFQDFC